MYAEQLLKPLEVKSLKLSNRVVMAPMTRSFSMDNIPGPDVAAYYKRRAENGVGLIITEGTVVEPKAGHGYPNVPDFAGEKALSGWKTVVEGVHEAGGKIFPQLWHVGSIRQTGVGPDPTVPGYGPSPVLHPFYADKPDSKETPVEMTQEDIDKVINAFSDAAVNAESLGFDGVEIHGAHGYLIDQFFWKVTNKRQDAYGGPAIGDRLIFAKQIIQAIRDRVSRDFPVCLRFSQWKMGGYDAKLAKTPKELEQFLLPLVDAGVDLFHCSTRRFFEPEFTDSTLNLAGWTKKITGKPVITVGSVGLDLDFLSSLMGESDVAVSKNSIDELIDRLEKGEFDLVAVGRALLADPAWVDKIVAGRFDEIKMFTKDRLMTLE